MQKFTLVLGEENQYLPRKIWSSFQVKIPDDKMMCVDKNNKIYEISYSDFINAEFGIGNGNLWLQCNLKNGRLVFCSPRKSWKSDEGKKLIEKINEVCEIKDMKAYKQYTGQFFIFAMFK